MKITVVFFLLIIASYFLGQWLSQENSSNLDLNVYKSSCDPTENICVVNDGLHEYTLAFTEKPSALVPFDVQLKIKNNQPDSIEISFDMDNMDMGYNVHQLVKNNLYWQARVILPMCSLSRNDWKLKVKLNSTNDSSATEFKFTQISN